MTPEETQRLQDALVLVEQARQTLLGLLGAQQGPDAGASAQHAPVTPQEAYQAAQGLAQASRHPRFILDGAQSSHGAAALLEREPLMEMAYNAANRSDPLNLAQHATWRDTLLRWHQQGGAPGR